MAGRFDPVRDSVESSSGADTRRSVSDEAGGHRKGARSASIADMLNEGSSKTSSNSSYAAASSNSGRNTHQTNHSTYPTDPRSMHLESPSMLSREHATREEEPRYLSPRERPELPHYSHSSGSISSAGRYHSPPTHAIHASQAPPSRDIRSERSPSLLHILNSNSHLDDSHRRPSSSSSVHSLGAPYASNNSPDIEYHARMQGHAHVYGPEPAMHRMHHSTASQRGFALPSARSSSSLGSGAEFAVPEVPHRSPETMRGRASLPHVGSAYSPSQAPYASPHSRPPLHTDSMEVDSYGRPILYAQAPSQSPGAYPGSDHPHRAANSTPLHIDTAYQHSQPQHVHQPSSPPHPPHTPYAQSPYRFPPTPGEYFGTPNFYTPRQHSAMDGHALGVPSVMRNGSKSPSQPGHVSQDRFEDEERFHLEAHRRHHYHEEEKRRMELLYRERETAGRFPHSEREQREWEDRGRMEAEARMAEEREMYDASMRARQREEHALMLAQEQEADLARMRSEEEEERRSRQRAQEEARAVADPKQSPQPSPPTATPAKKRKEDSGKVHGAQKDTEMSNGVVKPEVESANGNEKPKKGKAIKVKEVKVDPAKVASPPHDVQSISDDVPVVSNGKTERNSKPYQPLTRVSVPTMIRIPITSAELERMRDQSRNILRDRWRAANPDRSDGWRELIADFEAHQIAPNSVAPKVSGAAKKRKRLTAGAESESVGASAGGSVANSEVVAQHYNSRRDVGVSQRKNSPILELRNYNNWVKSVLIQRFGVRNGRVMELGGGKGGDLNKWDKLRIKHFVLADIADQSVVQARSRFGERKFSYTADFIAGDCFGEPLDRWMPRQLLDPMFDNLSLQFCLHYGWETQERAQQMMANIARFLRPGGTFIGTIPDCDQLRRRLQLTIDEDPSARSFGNRFYDVTFDNLRLDKDNRIAFKPFGEKYVFSLVDAVEGVPEYVVDWMHFESMARQNGLECIYRKTFEDLWHDEGRPARSSMRDLAVRMVSRPDSDVPIEPDLWQASTVYVAFAFEKQK